MKRYHVFRYVFASIVVGLLGCSSEQPAKPAGEPTLTISMAEASATHPKSIPVDPRKPVDTVLVKSIDLTGDRVPERVELALHSSDLYNPIKWELRVLSGRDTLYNFSDNGRALDDRFRDQEPESFLAQKYRFFFQDFAEFEVSDTLPSYLERDAYNRQYDGCIYATSYRSFEGGGHTPERVADSLACLMESRIRSKVLPIFGHSDGNVDVVLPNAFVQELNRFVPIYSD